MTEDVAVTALCGAEKRKGGVCRRPSGWGTNHQGVGRCKLHGGSTPTHELHGQVLLARRDALAMGRPVEIEPHAAILECVAIAAGEVQFASEMITHLSVSRYVGPVVTTRPLKEEKGAESLSERVEEHGPPALHIWIVVRQQATDRLVKYSKAAIDAGVAERQVRVAEGQAQMLADAYRRFVLAMGMDPSEPKVREAMRGSLTVIAGGLSA